MENVVRIEGDSPQREEYHPIPASEISILRVIWTNAYYQSQQNQLFLKKAYEVIRIKKMKRKAAGAP